MGAPKRNERRKGRGAVADPPPRYLTAVRAADADEPEQPSVATEVQDLASRSALSRNTSPDVPFDRSLNPYQGCEHGCVYCFARPTHAYYDLSPGLDFETKIFAKPQLPGLLRAELRRAGYRCRPVNVGANTDPYQPEERRRGLTRAVLAVLCEARHPFTITTKSALVTRDLDLIGPMARDGMAAVCISLTTLDGELARRMEPRAAAPGRRLETMAALARAGVPVIALLSPMIPGLTDHEIERLLAAASEAGAGAANMALLRLPLELKPMFVAWLEERYPNRASKVLNALRASRDGSLTSSTFGVRMTGTGPAADLLAQRFRMGCHKYGVAHRRPAFDRLDVSRFRPPAADERQPLLL